MKQSIRSLRSKIEQLAEERERAEKDSLEHTRRWQERAEELKAQGIQVILLTVLFLLVRWPLPACGGVYRIHAPIPVDYEKRRRVVYMCAIFLPNQG